MLAKEFLLFFSGLFLTPPELLDILIGPFKSRTLVVVIVAPLRLVKTVVRSQLPALTEGGSETEPPDGDCSRQIRRHNFEGKTFSV